MPTKTKKSSKRNAAARSSLARGSALPLPTAEDIITARKFVVEQKAKLRAGSKMTINTTNMKTRYWPTIEVWVKAKRQYLPLSVGDVWRYETAEARDSVLSALLNTEMCNEPKSGGATP